MGKRYRDLVAHYSTARGGCRNVLNVLADYADDDGECDPGVAAIADDAGLSERQVQRNLAKLVDLGQIEIIANAQGGRGLTTVYRLSIAAISWQADRTSWQQITARRSWRQGTNGPV